MWSDIVTELRYSAEQHDGTGYVMEKAAVEIERLRKECAAHKANADKNYLKLMTELDRRK